MAIVETLLELDWKAVLGLFVAVVLVGHVVAYVSDSHGLRSFPGPILAKLSDLWLARVAANGHRSEVVHELHEKYGEFPAPHFILHLYDELAITLFVHLRFRSKDPCPYRFSPI